MTKLSWLPGAIQELLRHVPTLLFEVVDWHAMRSSLPALTQRLFTGNGVSEVRQGLAILLPKQLRFGSITKQELNDQQKLQLGQILLELYFTQALSARPFFLDLRRQHFAYQGESWNWDTGNLWNEFTPQFALGVRELYAGYFNDNDPLFAQGLLRTGLVQEPWSAEDREAMAKLLRESFPKAEGPMTFAMADFQQSFQKVFQFLLEKKGRLTPDFLSLGILLVTLYLSLEELGHPQDVKAAYQRAIAQLPSPGV